MIKLDTKNTHASPHAETSAPADSSELELFLMDACRWIRPQMVAARSELTWRTLLWLMYTHLSLRAMAWVRFGQWCRRKRIPLMTGIVMRHLHRTYGLEISVNVPIGGGLYIAHPTGCVIAPSQIGQNCTVIAAVTVGMRNTWEFPALGDGVFIGAGARVLGGITLGDGAVIGANAVVIADVPAGATAVGVPAKIIRTGAQKAE
jgi:serine O-acetyltransferase